MLPLPVRAAALSGIGACGQDLCRTLFCFCFFFRVQHLSGSYLCCRGGWNEGHAGFGPTCLLWGLPPVSTPPTTTTSSVSFQRFFTFFALAVVLGTGHGPGTRKPPVAFLNSFLWHASSFCYSPVGFLPPQTTSSMTSSH